MYLSSPNSEDKDSSFYISKVVKKMEKLAKEIKELLENLEETVGEIKRYETICQVKNCYRFAVRKLDNGLYICEKHYKEIKEKKGRYKNETN